MTARHVAGAAEPPDGSYDADIIILALDREPETLAAIASALGQTAVSRHVFVLDQGSHPAVLQKFAQALHGRPDASLLAVERNLGVAGGRNLISERGNGGVIVALDNDAEFAAPDTVARLVAALDGEPRLAAIGCRIVTYSDGTDDTSSWGYPANLLPCAAENFDSVTYVGAGHAIRRTAWRDAGGYDSKLFFCWEEFDFCLRAIALGWRIRYRGDIVIRHKVAAQQRVGWTGQRWFYFVRNRLYIERKLGRPWPALLPRAAAYLVKGIRNGRPIETTRAILAAASMAPRSGRPPLPPEATSYLSRNDRAHRGSLPHRLMREVLVRIGRAPGLVATTRR